MAASVHGGSVGFDYTLKHEAWSGGHRYTLKGGSWTHRIDFCPQCMQHPVPAVLDLDTPIFVAHSNCRWYRGHQYTLSEDKSDGAYDWFSHIRFWEHKVAQCLTCRPLAHRLDALRLQ